jgi:hypothetical protein
MLNKFATFALPLIAVASLLSSCGNATTPPTQTIDQPGVNAFAGKWGAIITLQKPNGSLGDPSPALPLLIASDGKVSFSEPVPGTGAASGSIQGTLKNDGTTDITILASDGITQVEMVLTGKLTLNSNKASGKISAKLTSGTTSVTTPANVEMTRK